MKIEIIKTKINELEELAEKIENSGIEIIQGIPLLYKSPPPRSLTARGRYIWDIAPEEVKKIQKKTVRLYQRWYSTSLHFIKEYFDERRQDEFRNLYSTIIEYLQPKGSAYSSDKNKIIDKFLNNFDIQRGILLSIPDVIEVKEMNLRKLISADFVETELDKAEVLFNHKYERCAGALAGVALEKHLETMCQINTVLYKPKDTLDPLATKLYKNDYLDITELKKVQHLASIRNKCDHPDEITREEVRELIDETKKFIINH